jgi:hypothetical protein
MDAEFGGTPITNPAPYLNNSPMLRAPRMKSSGLKGVVISHGLLDGEVTSDMSLQMAAVLALEHIHTDIFTSVFKSPGTTPGLTLDGDVLGLIPGYTSPFAGHVSAVVLNTALARLTALYTQGAVPKGLSLTLSDGELGTFPLVG